jgi:hypothetical protein
MDVAGLCGLALMKEAQHSEPRWLPTVGFCGGRSVGLRFASLFANLRDAHNYANFIALARPVINSAASVSNAAMLR